MDAVAGLAPGSGLIAAACTALGLSRASLHRRQALRRQPLAPVRPRPTPRRALVAQERQVVLDHLREPRFVDLAPAEVHASLLDQGVHPCSIRAMYRVLAEHDEVRERRRQLRRPVHQKPELLAEKLLIGDIARRLRGICFHGVISIGAPTPILFVETTRRLRHLQIPTTSATAPAIPLSLLQNSSTE